MMNRCGECGAPVARFEDLPGWRHFRVDEIGRDVPYAPGHFPVLPGRVSDLTGPSRLWCARCRWRRARRGDWCLRCWHVMARRGMRQRGIPTVIDRGLPPGYRGVMLHLSVNGAAQLLAVIAEQNAGPLTPVLQAMSGLTIGADTTGWTWDGMTLHRTATLRARDAGPLTVARVTLELDALALPDGAVARLAAGLPAGTVVPGLRRTWRRALNVLGHPGRDGVAVISSATLELGGQAIGQAAEQITAEFCETAAAWLSGSVQPGPFSPFSHRPDRPLSHAILSGQGK